MKVIMTQEDITDAICEFLERRGIKPVEGVVVFKWDEKCNPMYMLSCHVEIHTPEVLEPAGPYR